MGFGKVVGKENEYFAVEYFYSVTHQECVMRRPDDLFRTPLAKQTRCYVFSLAEGRWYMGRIGERDGHEYEVNLPDRGSIWLPEQCIYVRCSAPTVDPTDTLIAKGHETARFHEGRSRLVGSLVRQRVASRGMTGLTSAGIELFAHQVEVARRVLEDPIQRYLLADEVGLGKTIEAGILVRQFLNDEPTGHVLVLVPELLLDQWRNELDSRFDAFRDDRVEVVSTSDLDRVSTRGEYGMMVIDEAHHVAAGASSKDPGARATFETCRRLTHETERVILLSATPAANHEAQFLAMLHLLDPKNYSLDDLEAFRERVRMRQEIGRLLLTITEEAKPFSLKLNVPKLAAMFPNDERLTDLGNEVLALLENNREDTTARARPIRAIRTHISDTYRLHRRMLRNRRSAIPDSILERGDQRVIAVHDDGDDVLRMDDALDEWRTLVSTAVRRLAESGHDVGKIRQDLRACFLVLVQAADGSPWILEQAVRWRLRGDADSARILEQEFSEDLLDRLRNASQMPGEAAALERLLDVAREGANADHRLIALLKVLGEVRDRAGRRAVPRCVVFTGFSTTARRIADRLAAAFGPKTVARHIAGMPRETVEDGVHRFKNDYDCFVLVCDRTAEEGRNFQFADHLVHFDLPWQPNRLEQRIGRVDRISRVRDLTTHVLLGRPAIDSLHEAWFRLLNDGLRLFESSIAGLQFFVEEKLPELVNDAFSVGPQGLLDSISTVRTEIEAEQERIDEQAAIDEINAQDESAVEFYQGLEAADADHAALQNAMEGWLCRTLNFEKLPDARTPRTIRYSATKTTIVPGDLVVSRFQPFLSRPGTYDRTVASRHPEVGLYRLGNGLVDALADYVAWDDRGQSFAIWREDPTWSPREGTEWVGFRFDVIVEADTGPARLALEEIATDRVTAKSLDRRADSLFPPKREIVLVDVALAEVTDLALRERLRKPFRAGGESGTVDHNLTKHRIGAIDEVISSDHWAQLCRDARDASLRILQARPSLREHCERFAEQASKKLELKLEQLRLRSSSVGPTANESVFQDLQFESGIGEALISGIRRPRVRVDAVGFIVISGRAPLAPREIHTATSENV